MIESRTGDVSGERPRSHKGKLGRRDSVPGHPTGRKSGRKPSCGRHVCGIVVGAQRDQCTSSAQAAKRKGCALLIQNEEMTRKRKREECAVCEADCTRNPRKVRTGEVAGAVRFFTIGKGAKRRDRSIDCTGAWLTDISLLWSTCRSSLSKANKCSVNTPTSDVQAIENDGHSASLPKKNAKVETRQQRLGIGIFVTVDDTLDIPVEERQIFECQGGKHGSERRIARARATS